MQEGLTSRKTGGAARACRVLLVDDDATLLMVLARAFAAAGYTTQTAENGRKALELLKTFKPALVITDIVMPEMEGIGAIMAIKQMADPPKVIAMSGNGLGGRRNYLKWAKHLGADEVLSKPFRLNEMLALAGELTAGPSNQLINCGS
jgi:two-component system sensor histidine kinase ChiS